MIWIIITNCCISEANEKAADNVSDKLQSVGISSGGADGAPSSSQSTGMYPIHGPMHVCPHICLLYIAIYSLKLYIAQCPEASVMFFFCRGDLLNMNEKMFFWSY